MNGWSYFCRSNIFNVTFVSVGTTVSCGLSTSWFIISLSRAVVWRHRYESSMLCGAFESARGIGWPSCCGLNRLCSASTGSIGWPSCLNRFCGTLESARAIDWPSCWERNISPAAFLSGSILGLPCFWRLSEFSVAGWLCSWSSRFRTVFACMKVMGDPNGECSKALCAVFTCGAIKGWYRCITSCCFSCSGGNTDS